jgi:hypothetical protein
MSNPLILGANNAVTALAGAISSGALSLTVTTGTGALFPQPTGGNYFVITAVDAATGSLREIMHVTAVVGDVFTVVRAQEGTTAHAYALNDPIANLWTIGQFNALAQTNQLGSAAYLTASDQIGGVSAIQPFAGGNPNGFVSGNASAGSVPPSMVWDTQDQIFWICVTTGNSASAVWIPLNQLQGTVWCGTSGGSANAQTLTPTIPITGYGPGLAISFQVGAGLTNTGAMTVNVSGKGNVSVYKDTPSGPAPLTGGECVAGNIVAMRYDGTHFQLTATDLGTASLYNTGATVVPIAGNLEIASPFGTTVTGVSYSFIQADRGKSRKRSNAGSAMTDTLPVVATLVDGWWVNVNNIDATANDTISPPAGAALNGVVGASLVLSPGSAARIGFDGSGFWVTTQPVSKLAAAQFAYVNILNAGQVIPPGAYEVDSSGGIFPLLLELSAVTGDNYIFRDFARTWGQFPVTLNGNGNTIAGSATSNLDVTGATAQITFSPSNWAYQ